MHLSWYGIESWSIVLRPRKLRAYRSSPSRDTSREYRFVIIRLCFLGLLVFANAASGKTTIPTLLPERTGFLLLVHDVSHFRTHIGETPLGRMWNEPSRNDANGSGFIASRIQVQTGLSLPAILSRFDDEAALVTPDLNSVFGAPEDKEDWALVALTKSDAPWLLLGKDVESANKSLGKVRSTKLAGQNMRVFVSAKKESTLAWTWAGGLGVLASSPHVLREMLSARQAPSHLDMTENWRSLERNASGGDLTVYANLEGVQALINRRVSGGGADTLGAMAGIMPREVMKALGLEAFRAVRMTVSLLADEAQVDAGVIVRDEPGLARLFAYQPGPIERPSFIPSDAIFAHASRFRISDFWNACMEMMDQVSPGVSYLARGQMEQMAEADGLDFEQDILANFGEESFVAYLPSTRAPVDTAGEFDQLSGVKIKNAVKAQKTMAALVDWTTSFGGDDESAPSKREASAETRTIKGVEVTFQEFGTAEKPSTLSYAIVDSTLLVAKGEKDILERALEARERGKSIWARSDLAPLLDSIPREAASVSCWEPAAFRQQLESTSKLKDESRQVAKMLLLGLGPSIAYTLKTPEGYFSRVRLRRAYP